MSMLELRRVSKRFESGFLAVADLDLDVASGEIVVVIGASGCGKSTLLRLIAGLEAPTSGEVRIAGQRVDGPGSDVGVIFQEPRLMPWLTVVQNVRFGLLESDHDRTDDLAAEAIARVGLTEFSTSLPRELSGGMAQRASIARALVTKPPVLLLDEPFSALDAFTRIDLQEHLLEVWGWYRPTLFMVTHDIDEALILADRILVMEGQPGHLATELEIDIPRPRRRTDPAFHRLQDRTTASLKEARRAVSVESG
jgi:sulfonate transport system ATP-binding protein